MSDVSSQLALPDRVADVSPPGRPVTLRSAGLWAAVLAVIAGAVAAGAAVGLWYLPFVGGFAIGVLTRLAGVRALGAVGCTALSVVGWPLILLARALSGEPIGATARAAGAFAGLTPSAVLVLAATVLVALLQSLIGVWLGRSVTFAMGLPQSGQQASPSQPTLRPDETLEGGR